MNWTLPVLLVSLLGTGAVAAQAPAPESTSSALVKQLVTLMSERKLDTVAATDPETPDRFVAAMAFPDVQLLVVAAKHPTPAWVRAQLVQKQYRDIYGALQQVPIQEGQIFFHDLGCDGLRGEPGETIDIMYERGTTQTLFDGDWKKAGLSEDAYRKKFQDAEAQYSRLLTLLVQALRRQSS